MVVFILFISDYIIGTLCGGHRKRVSENGDRNNNQIKHHSHFNTQHWKVFNNIRELFILVPALLGLKGNLDMCLASRLSTQANLGHMTSNKEVLHMIIGNISLVQVQATVAAFIVAVFAITIGAIMNNTFVLEHALLLVAASMFTATSSCFVLGEFLDRIRMVWGSLIRISVSR